MGQGGKGRRNAGVAVIAGASAQLVNAPAHGRLVVPSGFKGGKYGVGYGGVGALVIGGAGEGRVHNHQVKPGIGYFAGERIVGVQQVQRTDAHRLVRLPAVGHGA